MSTWAWVLVLIGLLLLVGFTGERLFFRHMRREVYKAVWSRREGGSYKAKPWASSGWFVVAIVLLLVLLILVVAS